MPDDVFAESIWQPQLLKWLVALALAQCGVLVAACVLADSHGPGLAQYPAWMLGPVAAVALSAVVWEVGVVRAAGFRCKVLVTLPSTALNVVDVATDSLAAASVIAAASGDSSKLEDAWRLVTDQSALPFHTPLWLLAILAWLAGGLQFALAFVSVLAYKDGFAATGADLMGFETFALLSEGQRTEEEQDENEEQRTEAEQRAIDARRRGAESQADFRVLVKFLLRLLIENLFQLHLQLTCIGLSVALSGWTGAARSMLLSVSISAFFLTMKLLQAVPTMASILAGTATYRDKPVSERIMWVGVPCVPTLLLVVYAAAKFWALFQCPQHLLNVTGCVELDL
eukprot:CAMPEP_0204307790 /NCGR_PEP_ID=MMETSP0469-20131031/121_1 /ASSEMBLY_ACC=CAM_ASM_000384 /TAXON_ID=2969 /ORGANISM="Oxyrrhis marina" /LENGTH=340 /DNA_ID=CAMNT_0051287177 /DNA_START=18 /DNA_END=1040 /DNA_ORIENTATION=+